MSAINAIVRFVLEAEDDDLDVKEMAGPDLEGYVHAKGERYGRSIVYGNYKIRWYDYPDGKRLVDLSYRVPFQLYWRKDPKTGQKTKLVRREVAEWSGGAEIVELKPPFNWDTYMRAVFAVLDKTPDPWKRRYIPQLPEQYEIEEPEMSDD